MRALTPLAASPIVIEERGYHCVVARELIETTSCVLSKTCPYLWGLEALFFPLFSSNRLCRYASEPVSIKHDHWANFPCLKSSLAFSDTAYGYAMTD